MASQQPPEGDIADLMQNTIDSQRERSQKKKARALKKKLRQQKTKSIADQEHQSDVEAEALPLKDPKPKQQIQYKKGELAIIVDNLENHYFDLVGNGKSADYKQRRDKAWSRLIDSLNEWNESEGYPVVREYDSVKRKIDNLKQRAKEKSRLHKKHVTGGGPPPPDYNEMDLAILRILGDSPAFKGVPVDDDDDLDSTIEVTKDPSVTDSMLKKCNALAVGRTSSVVKALNSETHLDLFDFVSKAEKKKIKKKLSQMVKEKKIEDAVASVSPVVKISGQKRKMVDDTSEASTSTSDLSDLNTSDDSGSSTDKSNEGLCDEQKVPNNTGKGKANPSKNMLPKNSGKKGKWNVTDMRQGKPGRGQGWKNTAGGGDDSSDEEPSRSRVTSYRRVRTKRGYTTYPAYLFDIPPAKLNIENLRRQFLIAEIERSKAEKNYYQNACNFMNFVKTKGQTLLDKNGLNLGLLANQGVKIEEGDHGYAMNAAVVIDDEEEVPARDITTLDLSQAEIIPSSQITLVTSGVSGPSYL